MLSMKCGARGCVKTIGSEPMMKTGMWPVYVY